MLLGGINMTIPELEQYLSRMLRYVENPNFLISPRSADGQRAHLFDYHEVDGVLDDENPEDDGLRIHIHSNSSHYSHSFFEMMYVRTGNIALYVDNAAIEMESGDYLLIAPGVPHRVDNCGTMNVSLSFIFSKAYFTPFALHQISKNQLFYEFIVDSISDKPLEKSFIHIRAGKYSDVLKTADQLLCEFFDPDSCSASMQECLLASLLNQLFRVWKENGGSIRHRRNVDDGDVQQILRYIETNSAAASLKDAAVRFGYHPDYLSRLMKNRLGYTFSDIKHLICIDQAKFLLLNSDLTVQQVAEHVGFSNMSFFYELFDRYCETTPAKYREDFGQLTLQL